MIKEVTQIALPVNEKLIIQKNVLSPEKLTGEEKRLCIVTGTHGDELEGQYVCYALNKRINEAKEHLKGIVEIYPALNPLGIDSITRGIPCFDLDMNRIFPGSQDGAMTECVAAEIIEDITGADLCIDIHASNIFLREVPQVRVSEETASNLVPYAKLLNIQFIWVHAASTVLKSTLAHSLNSRGVPTLVVEMGVGMRTTKAYGEQLVEGIFNLMRELGIWDGEVKEVMTPIVSSDHKVGFVNANASGFFVPEISHWENVTQGSLIGKIVCPLTGEVLEEVVAPCDGIIFTLREYPVVYTGSLIARVLGGEQ